MTVLDQLSLQQSVTRSAVLVIEYKNESWYLSMPSLVVPLFTIVGDVDIDIRFTHSITSKYFQLFLTFKLF